MTLCIIENFLDFKMGEIWQEIVTELDMEGVQLIAPDGEATDTILRATEERGLGSSSTIQACLFHEGCFLAVAATQNYILEQYRKQDLQFEKAFYDDVSRERECANDRWLSFLLSAHTKSCLQGEAHRTVESVRRPNVEISVAHGRRRSARVRRHCVSVCADCQRSSESSGTTVST